MIAKNGIDWETMGFTVYGECPEYKGYIHKIHSKDKKINISYEKSYKLWERLIQINETVINPPAELGRLTDAGGGEQSIKIENSAV